MNGIVWYKYFVHNVLKKHPDEIYLFKPLNDDPIIIPTAQASPLYLIRPQKTSSRCMCTLHKLTNAPNPYLSALSLSHAVSHCPEPSLGLGPLPGDSSNVLCISSELKTKDRL
jgi:hypothetical protein